MSRGARIVLGVVVAAAAGCRSPEAASLAATPAAISVTSTAFTDGAAVPARYTCSGADVSPPLTLKGVPATARGLAIVVDDPDAPGGTFTHWLAWNLPASTASVAEGSLPAGAREGDNDFGKTGYGGPCPPPGAPHHYRFQVLALDRALDLAPRADRAAFDRAVAGRVLARGTLTGTYGR